MTIIDNETSDAGDEVAPDGAGAMYQQAESIFGAVASDLVKRGWSIFPQSRDASRRPGHVNFQGIRWIEDHQLPDKLPTPEALALWVKHCSTLNVAAALGPGSGHSFCVDIDVTDEEDNARFVDLADEILGYSPLRRVGRAPKIALFYRYDPEDPIVNVARKFVHVNEDGSVKAADQGIDVQSRGKAITIFGRHHSTGRYFTYLDGNPLLMSPSDLPLVTSDQMKAWLEAVDSHKRFFRSTGTLAGSGATAAEWVAMGEVKVPNMRLVAGGTGWVEDNNGLVVEGREFFLYNLAYRTITDISNQGISDAIITERIVEAFQTRAEMSGKWSESFLRGSAQEKVRRIIRQVASGKIQVSSASNVKNSDGDAVSVGKSSGPVIVREKSGELSFLPPAPTPDRPFSSRGQWTGTIVDGPAGAAEEREIKEDRSEAIAQVKVGLRKAFDEFFDEVYRDPNVEFPWRVHVLKAPPGAGKTSAAIHYIASDPRTKEPFLYRDQNNELKEGRAPIVFLLPTYANIEELRDRAQNLNIDPTLSDEEIAAQALEMGIVSEADLDSRIADLRRDAIGANLVTMVYRGKIAAGCAVAEKVQMAMSAGIGTAGFCKADVKSDDGVVDTEYCPHYHECPAIAQRRSIEECDVVFMPHSFIELNIPEELKHVRAVIADERVHHLFLHTATFSASALMIARKRPKLTRRESDAGFLPEDMLVDRNLAAEIVLEAIRSKACPVQALRRQRDAGGQPIGDKLLRSALRVCSSAVQKDGNITPSLSVEEVISICEQPTGTWIREEHRFWKIIAESYELEAHREIGASRVAELEHQLANLPVHADATERQRLIIRMQDIRAMFRLSGDRRDRRIQFLLTKGDNGSISETIRISWRTEPNWRGMPVMLLDASAETDIVRKIWGGVDGSRIAVEVVEHLISAPRNIRVVAVVDRTYSNASIVGTASQTDEERAICASVLTKMRRAISAVSGLYGWNRVVAGASIIVRRAINTDWVGPDNVDWCHFGAMRGLDFAKHHAAAISIGRMEIPVHSIDGLAAALTYDDDAPELPFDRNGNGLDDEGKTIEVPKILQTVPLRNGQNALIPTPTYEGRWARLIQKQYREEELLQFEGRLRPVYRNGRAPVWYTITSVVPEGVIVDDVICLDDLIGRHALVWEAARRSGGVIEPQVMKSFDPTAFPTSAVAAKALEEIGFFGANAAGGRLLEGLTQFEWRTGPSGEWKPVLIQSFVPNPAEAIVAALQSAYGIVDIDLRPDTSTAHPQGRRRAADKIDLELGDRERRRRGEESITEEVCYRALLTGVRVTSPVPAAAGGAGIGSLRANQDAKPGRSFADMESKEALARMWVRVVNRGSMIDEVGVVSDNNSETFEDLGNHVSDATPGHDLTF